MKMKFMTIADQPSWVVASNDVELAVTRLGGHLAPVKFYRHSDRPVQPYYVNPWHAEARAIDEPVLVPLRGDFFCLPFGGGCEYKGTRFRTHGEPATSNWELAAVHKAGRATSLTLTMKTRLAPGVVTKKLTLLDGHNVVYDQHVLEGFSGRYPIAHHATLAMPLRQQSVQLATSAVRFGMTNPTPPGNPAAGSYYCLEAAARFADLRKVPTIWRSPAAVDCTSFPTRRGYCDQLAVFHKAALPAWTAATFQDEGYVWFSLKDPAVLPTLMLWVENHGRYAPPWDGRNCCLGLEDVCGFLAEGMSASVRPNALSKAGVPTAVRLSPSRPTVVNYIQGVVKVPPGFKKVRKLTFQPGQVTFHSTTGKCVTAAVQHEFLTRGEVKA